jgi:hypothetical protein
MKFGGKRYSKSSYEYGVGKINLKKTEIFLNNFPCLFILEWAKKNPIWNYPMYDNNDLWNLKLSYLN